MRPPILLKTSKLSSTDKMRWRIPQLSWYVRKRTKTMTGCSRFIEGQNVISAKIMDKKKTGEKTYLSYKQKSPSKINNNNNNNNILFYRNVRKSCMPLLQRDVACVASVSVLFRSRPCCFGAKKDWGTRFSVLAAREMKREATPPRLLAPFFARPLLRNSTETLATQAKRDVEFDFSNLPTKISVFCQIHYTVPLTRY